MKADNEDRRIIKTKATIRKNFEQMIIDMDYADITVKELAQRANINRKTFYLHYTSLDDLFKELQTEVTQKLAEIIDRALADKRVVTLRQYLFHFHKILMENPPLHKKLMFSDSYQFVFINVNSTLLERWNVEGLSKSTESDERRLVFEISCACILAAYKSWFLHECSIPAERLIDIICETVTRSNNSISVHPKCEN